MSDDVQLSISLPLDSDDFLRRECPTCEREFKWLPQQEDAGDGEDASAATARDAEAPQHYYCPYCAVTAPSDAWLIGTIVVSVIAETTRRAEAGVNLGPIHIPGRPGLQEVALASAMLAILLLRPRGITGGKELHWPLGKPSAADLGLLAPPLLAPNKERSR
jgi:hypothetical protein